MPDRQRPVVIATCEFPPFPGGIGTYAGELTRALVTDGVAVTVLGPAYGAGDSPVAGIEHHPILGHHKLPLSAIPRLLRVIRSAPRDAILLAADIRTTLLLSLLKPLHGRSYRTMVHGSEASKFRAGSPIFRLAQRAYRGADLVAYNRIATRDIFRAQLGQPRRDAITYLGVEAQWFSPPAGEAFEHVELAQIAADAPVFVSVGRLEPRKGQLETVTALAMARDRFGLPDPVYVVVGRAEEESYPAQIAEEARKHAIRVILTGRIGTDDIKRLYRRAAAHVLFAPALPGKIEGFGLVLVEAAAAQCPSIAAAVGGIPEVLGDTGALVPPDDIAALAEQLAAYGMDRSRGVAAAEAACLRARQFTWANCAAATFPELNLASAGAG